MVLWASESAGWGRINARIKTCSNSSFSLLQKVTCRREPKRKTFLINNKSLIVTHFSCPCLLQKSLKEHLSSCGRLKQVPVCEGLQRGSGSESQMQPEQHATLQTRSWFFSVITETLLKLVRTFASDAALQCKSPFLLIKLKSCKALLIRAMD